MSFGKLEKKVPSMFVQSALVAYTLFIVAMERKKDKAKVYHGNASEITADAFIRTFRHS